MVKIKNNYFFCIDSVPGKARRTLILISKVVQNIANNVEFEGSKEPYMVIMNPIIIECQQSMCDFEDAIAVNILVILNNTNRNKKL